MLDPTPPTPPLPPEPWVGFPLYATSNIGSTPTKVFPTGKTAILQSMKIVNMVNETTRVFAYVLRTIEDSLEQHFLANGIPINALESINILEKDILNIEPTDSIYVYSDYSSKKLTCFISPTTINDLTIGG